MTKSSGNPFLDRFDGLENIDALRSRVTLPAKPANLHDGMDESQVIATARNALHKYYIPTKADLDLIYGLVMQGKAYCEEQYPTLKEYACRYYEDTDEREPEFVPPICLTGPPGTGKTALVGAIQRVFSNDCPVDLGAGHDGYLLEGSWIINVKNKTSIASALRGKILPDIRLSKTASVEQLTRICRKIAYRQGASILVLDELQDALQRNGKPSFIADTVKGVGYLGVPYMFVANYNLCSIWKAKLPRQDRQRILKKPIVLQPSASDSEDWLEYLEGAARIFGRTLEIDIADKRHLLHRYTAGNKRFMIELLLGALSSVWRQRRRVVRMRDVEKYYDSTDYCVNRDDVEQANSLVSSRRRRSIDYDCPFDIPKVTSAAIAELERKAAAEKVNVILVRDAMTKPEKEAHARSLRESEAKFKKMGHY